MKSALWAVLVAGVGMAGGYPPGGAEPHQRCRASRARRRERREFFGPLSLLFIKWESFALESNQVSQCGKSECTRPCAREQEKKPPKYLNRGVVITQRSKPGGAVFHVKQSSNTPTPAWKACYFN